MCEVKEAERHEQLAEIYASENDKQKAIAHYLEATAIYVLNIQIMKKESLLLNANKCYQKVQKLRGEKVQNFTKTELAKLMVEEMDLKSNNNNNNSENNHNHHNPHNHPHTPENNSHHHHHHELNLLSEIEELL